MSGDNGAKPPSGWASATVGDIAQYVNGAAFKPTDWTATGTPIIRIQNLTDSNKPINRTHRQINSRLLIRQGDLLFSWSATLDAFIWQREDAWLNQHIFKVEPEGGISNRFAYYLLRHTVREITSSEHMHGSTMQHINRGPFLAYPIALPPLSEQSRITDALDELISDLDSGVRALEGVRAKLKQYRSAVLKAAVEGALTVDWRAANPDAEPASELLKRILIERRRRWEEAQLKKYKDAGKEPPNNWKAKYKEPLDPDTSKLPVLPERWSWATVEQISSKVVDGVHKKPDYVHSGIPFVTVRNLTAGPAISFEKLNYITPTDHAEFIKRANPERGDILVSKDGTLGVIREIKTDRVFSIFVSVAMIKPIERSASTYLTLALQAPQVQSQMVPKGSGLAHIHLEDLRKDCVPLASVQEQSTIVETVESQLSVVDHLEADLESKLTSAQALRQSILRAAFEGQLVPQDPNDEPAGELLKRIAAERAEREMQAKAAKQAAKLLKPRKPRKIIEKV